MGAVAYHPKVVTIWDGFQQYFAENNLSFDYVLYSNYEQQVEAHFRGHIDVAWNSPLAWLQTDRLAEILNRRANAICMRDTDQNLTSVIIVRSDSPIQQIKDLYNKRVGVGAYDSPQATLIPLYLLKSEGLQPQKDFDVVTFDVMVGKHGDHIGGEREAATALKSGQVNAACLLDSNLLTFSQEGLFSPGTVKVIGRTPIYDHCNFTVLDKRYPDLVERFQTLLLDMSYSNPKVRPLLDLEGLKAWRPGRTKGYGPLQKAIASFGTIEKFTKELATQCS